MTPWIPKRFQFRGPAFIIRRGASTGKNGSHGAISIPPNDLSRAGTRRTRGTIFRVPTPRETVFGIFRSAEPAETVRSVDLAERPRGGIPFPPRDERTPTLPRAGTGL